MPRAQQVVSREKERQTHLLLGLCDGLNKELAE